MKYAVVAVVVILSLSLGSSDSTKVKRQFNSPPPPTAPPMGGSTMGGSSPVASDTAPPAPTSSMVQTTADDTDVNTTVAAVTSDSPVVTTDVAGINTTLGGGSNDTTTDVPSAPVNTTVDVPVVANVTNSVDVNTTMGPDTMAPNTTVVITTVPTTTATTTPPCKAKEENEYYAAVRAFTALPLFRELSINEQIFIYEMLAAGEGCNMIGFINPETTERLFRLLLDLPLRYITTFVKYVDKSLTLEGVIVPV